MIELSTSLARSAVLVGIALILILVVLPFALGAAWMPAVVSPT